MKDLIIHIGAHKTGSTAIQRALVDSRDMLAGRGISYPDIGFSYYGHHKLQRLLERGQTPEVEAMIAALNALSGTVVVSSENFSRSNPAGIETFARLVNFSNVRIVYYQRNILDMIRTWWHETVKHGSRLTLLAYYANCLTRPFAQHILNPIAILERWASVFGRDAIQIYLYDKIEDVSGQFFADVLGIEGCETSYKDRHINKSIDLPTTELMRCLNAFGLHSVRAILDDPDAKAVREKVKAAAKGKSNSIELNLDCFVFSHIENRLRSEWRDRMVGFEGDGPLFAKRSVSLEYLDSDFWFSEPALAEEVSAYAKLALGKNQHLRPWLLADGFEQGGLPALAQGPRGDRQIPEVGEAKPFDASGGAVA